MCRWEGEREKGERVLPVNFFKGKMIPPSLPLSPLPLPLSSVQLDSLVHVDSLVQCQLSSSSSSLLLTAPTTSSNSNKRCRDIAFGSISCVCERVSVLTCMIFFKNRKNKSKDAIYSTRFLRLGCLLCAQDRLEKEKRRGEGEGTTYLQVQ